MPDISDEDMTIGNLKWQIREVCDKSPFLKRDISTILKVLAGDYAVEARREDKISEAPAPKP